MGAGRRTHQSRSFAGKSWRKPIGTPNNRDANGRGRFGSHCWGIGACSLPGRCVQPAEGGIFRPDADRRPDGAAGGTIGGYLATRLQERFAQAAGSEQSVTETMMIQAAAWTCAGVGIAIGVWIASAGRRSLIDTLFGGVLAGAAVAILYPPIVGLLFSDEDTDRLFPEHGLFPQNAAKGSETGAFLFWVLFNGVVFSMILGGIARRAKISKGTDSAATAANGV